MNGERDECGQLPGLSDGDRDEDRGTEEWQTLTDACLS